MSDAVRRVCVCTGQPGFIDGAYVNIVGSVAVEARDEATEGAVFGACACGPAAGARARRHAVADLIINLIGFAVIVARV